MREQNILNNMAITVNYVISHYTSIEKFSLLDIFKFKETIVYSAFTENIYLISSDVRHYAQL